MGPVESFLFEEISKVLSTRKWGLIDSKGAKKFVVYSIFLGIIFRGQLSMGPAVFVEVEAAGLN